ncbi:hypothetical protein [Amphritea sp.]
MKMLLSGFGAGAAYTMSAFSICTEIERFEIGKSNMDLVTVGKALNF